MGTAVTEKTMPDFKNIQIRPAVLADMDELVLLLKELFSIEEDFVFDETLQRRGLALMLSDTEQRCILVAEYKRKAIGMCTAQILVSTAEGWEVGLVEDMVVRESFCGKGIGGLLLSSIENWAREKRLKRLQLLADRNNAPGLRFYEKMNWAGTDLICLRKRIPEE